MGFLVVFPITFYKTSYTDLNGSACDDDMPKKVVFQAYLGI